MSIKLALPVIGLLLFITLPAFADLYTEWLWFGEVGFQDVFLKTLVTKGVSGVVFFIPAFLFLFFNFRHATRGSQESYVIFPGGGDLQPIVLQQRHLSILVFVLAAVLSLFLGMLASSQWLTFLRFLEPTSFGTADPLFGRDPAFYIFTLPFLDIVRFIFFAFVMLALVGATIAYVALGRLHFGPDGLTIHPHAQQHLLLLFSAFFLLLAWGAYLDVPRLLNEPSGIVYGASYVDVTIRVFSLGTLMIVSVLAAGTMVYSAMSSSLRLIPFGIGGYLLVWIGGGAVAALVQNLVVTPDEADKEAPFLVHNIAATQKAFDLDAIEERQVSGDASLTLADIENNSETINNVRLWDHQPLLDTFGQIQEIRTYYEFASVDNDRYVVDGEYRQTMLSSRELNSDSLPNRSWVNERLQYTHGFGVALGPVNQVTQEGLPVLFIQDLPPQSQTDLSIEQPSIYFGELSNDYVLVNTETDEFHYPEGEDNVSTRYDGDGGVEIGNLFRRLLFSLRFRSYETLVSSQISRESRIIFHRNISDRVATIAPFLRYDADPYLVVADGRLYWMRDAYTVTDRYPYSSPVTSGINYIRNSVKIVIDAYNGTTTFYLAEPDDPIAQTLSKIFPGWLKPLETMPAFLRSHIRYPEGIFSLQTEMYSTFHMTNPAVFYNREDEWEVPVIDNEQMEPYYTIMRLPGEESAEFIQMLPFTPRGKNNMAAWMVARSDGDNYGKMMVFQFPKQKVVFGPSQIVARINQDQEISPQLTLWNQQGSEVIQGTLLVIPIEEALLYIRPMYLRASGGRIPELKRVVVAYQNAIVMEETLDQALDRLFPRGSGSPEEPPPETIEARLEELPASDQPFASTAQNAPPSDDLAGLAQSHYARALRAQQDGNWALYGEEIERLGSVLNEMQESGGGED